MNIRAWLSAGMILLLGATASPLASAQDFSRYVGGSFGVSDAHDRDVFNGTEEGWKLFGGAQLHKNIGLETAYIRLGDAVTSLIIASLDGLAIEGVGIIPIGEKGAVFAKAGLFLWKAGFITLAPETGIDPTFGVGGQYAFGNNWAVRAEWERFSDVGNSDVDLFSASVLYRFR